MASAHSAALVDRQIESYADTSHEKSIEVTLGTAGTVTAITLPDNVKGIKINPRTNPIRFSVNTSPAAVATSSAATIAASAFAVGGICKADIWETRLLPSSTSRVLYLRSVTSSVVVDLEVF